jgi:hypothetical protein
MATRPVKCPYDEVPGFKFNRGFLVLDDGKSNYPDKFIKIDDIVDPIISYSKITTNILPNSCYLLSQVDITDENGYVSFILVKSTFPNNLVESRKYLTWEYQSYTYNMGKLMVLSGLDIVDFTSTNSGWNISHPTVSPDGGIIFCNPHSDITIKLEILVGR